MPAGNTIHASSAQARPQIKPAPGLVARLAKNNPKISPNREPQKTPCASKLASNVACIAPPSPPMHKPRRGSTGRADPARVSFGIAIEVWDSLKVLPLFQLDRLHDILWKEQLDSPIHQDANFALQTGKFSQIDSAPHQPGNQTRKS